MPAECCLQEAGWNPYYALLLGRLAASSTSHAVTLQYCLWDHFKARRCRLQIDIASLPSDRMRQRPLNMRPRLTPDARRACLPAVQVVSAGCGACDALTCACNCVPGVQGVAEAEPRRTAHLARLTASLISGGALPLSVLKVQTPARRQPP